MNMASTMTAMKDSAKNATQKMYNLSKQIMSDRSNLGTTLIWIVIILLFIAFVSYIHNVNNSLQYKRCGTSCTQDNTNCNLATIYNRNSEFASKITSINPNSPQCDFFFKRLLYSYSF